MEDANNVMNWDLNKGEKTELEWLLKELVEIANVIASSILTMKGRK